MLLCKNVKKKQSLVWQNGKKPCESQGLIIQAKDSNRACSASLYAYCPSESSWSLPTTLQQITASPTHPSTTCRRNLSDLSTTSSHTGETELSSKSVASGRDCKASRDSVSSSLQRSASSPWKEKKLIHITKQYEKWSGALPPRNK